MIAPIAQLEDLLRRAATPGPHEVATDQQRAALTVERAALLNACEALLPTLLAEHRATARALHRLQCGAGIEGDDVCAHALRAEEFGRRLAERERLRGWVVRMLGLSDEEADDATITHDLAEALREAGGRACITHAHDERHSDSLSDAVAVPRRSP